MTANMETIILGADTPRAHNVPWGYGNAYLYWYLAKPDDYSLSPQNRHNAALRALPPLTYIREWAKQWKPTRTSRKAA